MTIVWWITVHPNPCASHDGLHRCLKFRSNFSTFLNPNFLSVVKTSMLLKQILLSLSTALDFTVSHVAQSKKFLTNFATKLT